MSKRSSYEVEKRILFKVAEGPAKFTDIQLSTNTNYDTVKMHCEKYKRLGILDVKTIVRDAANGRPSHQVVLTPLGKEVVKHLKAAK